MRIKATLAPLKNKIKYRIRGSRLFCSITGNELPRTKTLNTEDDIWNRVFSSELEKKKFMDSGKPIDIISDLNNFGYDSCDSSGNRKEVFEKIKLQRVQKSFVWRSADSKISLYFDFKATEKSLSFKNCWRVSYNDEIYSGYLSALLDTFKNIIEPFSKEEIDAINKELDNHMAWQEYALMRFKQTNG